MPFQIVRNDITHMRVDAIVNTANPLPMIGSGTDSAIHEAAGPRLLKARQKIGNIAPGCAAITPAFRLHAKHVMHTVGPVWEGGYHNEEALLRSCYDTCLKLALAHKCRSIAFPLISSGNYGFPKDKALQIAIAAFSEFLLAHEMQIYLVVFDRDAYRLSEKLFHGVASYIDQHYVDTRKYAFYRTESRMPPPPRPMAQPSAARDYSPRYAPELSTMPKAMSLEQQLAQLDAGFSETLLKLIDASGKKDSDIYKKAAISKQLFSKIRNNPNYKPTKQTAIALALALELNVAQTNDLIGRAGYTLTRSSKFDLIIRYFIEQGNFNIVEINIALYEFDQELLGS